MPLPRVCIPGRHVWGEWQLRPPLVAIAIDWLYWQRTCGRCGRSDRRWFQIIVPAWYKAAKRAGVTPERYLARLGIVAPQPDTLSDRVPRGSPEDRRR